MTIEIGLLCVIVGAIVSSAGLKMTLQKNTKEEARKQAEMSVKLDSMANGINNIQIKIEAQNNKLEEFNMRLVRVEESAKSLHNRVNSVESVMREMQAK